MSTAIVKAMEEISEENRKVQTRRSSRSVCSISPLNSGEGMFEEEIDSTRSQSVESAGYELADSKKKKRKATNKISVSNKRQANTKLNSLKQEESERELRAIPQKSIKDTKGIKNTQRDNDVKEKLEELDKIEKEVKDGSHTDYHQLLAKIEEKRDRMLIVAKIKKSLAEGAVYNLFKSQKESACSQYHWDKLALRRSMIENVQRKLNKLEQEYYMNNSNSDNENFTDWAPPERPTTISSLTLGLTNEESEYDLILASKFPYQKQPTPIEKQDINDSMST